MNIETTSTQRELINQNITLDDEQKVQTKDVDKNLNQEIIGNECIITDDKEDDFSVDFDNFFNFMMNCSTLSASKNLNEFDNQEDRIQETSKNYTNIEDNNRENNNKIDGDKFINNFDIIKNNGSFQGKDKNKNLISENHSIEDENRQLKSDNEYLINQLYIIQKKYEEYNILRRKHELILEKLKKYITARIDIKSIGSSKNNIEVIETSDPSIEIEIAKWLCNDKGNGIKIQCCGNNAKIKIKCIENGKVFINFKAIDYRYKKNRLPIYIKYLKIFINGNQVKISDNLACHDSGIRFSKTVDNNELIDIYIEWEPL